MKASKNWGACACKCGKSICQGDEFVIIDGSMYLMGHQDRRTRQMPAIKPEPKRDDED